MSLYPTEKQLERLTHWHKAATIYKSKRLFGPGYVFKLKFDDGREEILDSQDECHRIYNMLATKKLS
jgi:hypothetical protein